MRNWLRPLPVWLSVLVFLAIGVVLAPVSGMVRDIFDVGAFCFPSIWVVVAVHEFGHWVGGYLVGHRFSHLTLGPIKVVSTGHGLRLSVNDAWLPFASVCAVPVDLGHLNRKLAIISAAGPAANLLLTGMIGGPLLAWFVMALRREVLLRHIFSHWGGQYLFLVASTTTLSSLLCGMMNLIPFHEAYITSDGGRLLLLWRGGPKADRLAANTAILAASTSGLRPREWDPEWVNRSIHLADSSPEYAGSCMLAYARALDLEDGETARAFLERARIAAEKIPILKPYIGLEAAYVEARFGWEPAHARALLDAARRDSRDPDAHRVAEVAVLLAEGRTAEARARVPEALAALGRALPVAAGGNVMYAEWLKAVAGGTGLANSSVNRVESGNTAPVGSCPPAP